MSRTFRSLAHHVATSSLALPLLLVSACGGGGSSHVASVPPPPTGTPTPTPHATGVEVQTSWLASPATQAGDYDVIGRLTLTPGNGGPTSYRTVSPGEFLISTQRSGPYALTAPAGVLPGGFSQLNAASPGISWDFNAGGPNYRYDNMYGDSPQYLGQNLKEFDVFADGTKTLREDFDYTRGSSGRLMPLTSSTNLQVNLLYDVGYSYIAMGEWSWRVVDLNGTTAGDFGDLLFVNGDRTPASGIPVSGTAVYDARTLLGWVSGTFALTADFGQRAISTQIDQDYQFNPAGDIMDNPLAVGLHVAGSAPFSNSGVFNVPLAGTANIGSGYQINTPATPPSQSVTGTLDGAFFGPHAEQVGGVLSLDNSRGVQLLQDAFVGQQTGP